MLLPLASIALIAASSTLAQQIQFDAIHNRTSITGTWSSGSRGVVTGPGFANPVAYSFNYPNTTGVSYSFSDDGWFEEAQYRFKSNATDPRCIAGIMRFQHGRYELLGNGSIVMNPIPEDGRIQVQDTCPSDGVSNFIVQFNVTILMQSWRIFEDTVDGYKLHLFQFDGAPLAPMYQVSTDPIMLPKTSIVNAAMNATQTQSQSSASPSSQSKQKRSSSSSLNDVINGSRGMLMVALASLISLGLVVML